jgi:hypothetical protein
MDYEDTVADAKVQAVEAGREVLSELEGAYAPHTQDRDRLLALAELAQRRLVEGRDAQAEWVRQGGALVKAYRDENAQVRSDPAPAYFARALPADAFRHGLAGAVPAAAAELEASRANAERAEAQIRAYADQAARIHAANVQALSGLKAYATEAADSLQARIDGLKASVDREADANLNRRAPVGPTSAHAAPAYPVQEHGLDEPGRMDPGMTPPRAAGHTPDPDALGPLERVGGP